MGDVFGMKTCCFAIGDEPGLANLDLIYLDNQINCELRI